MEGLQGLCHAGGSLLDVGTRFSRGYETKCSFCRNGASCTPCHGSGGQGQRGYPNLTAGRWLWGGTLGQIDTTIAHGIRADDPYSQASATPAFGTLGVLKPQEIREVANYVRTLGGLEPNRASMSQWARRSSQTIAWAATARRERAIAIWARLI
jgi:cbb3-type cytochrome c oxidase subunit III